MRIQPDATPGDSPSWAGHRPVLLHPLIENLQSQPGHTVVDGTLGAGGVTFALSERVGPSGKVIAIDRDPGAVQLARVRFADMPQVTLVHGDFADLVPILGGMGIEAVDVVTLDLGISSVQLDNSERGFTFQADGPLDMRLDRSGQTLTAADIVNHYDEVALARMLRDLGGERFARPIARSLVRARARAPLTRTVEVRQVVEASIPRRLWPARIHPATRTFQALRIEVNDELSSLQRGLQATIQVLRPGGRLGVISFHSLEDTLVKTALHVAATDCLCPPQQPICTCAHRASLSLPSRRAIRPDATELAANPRSRSARLRVAIRLSGEG